MFVESCQALEAEKKVSMLRLFDEQIDLSDPDSDGWKILHYLVEAYNRECVPIPYNSTSWFCGRMTKEVFVAATPSAVWCGLQYGARAYLVHERSNHILEKLLRIHTSAENRLVAATAHWLALRAAQHEVLYMCLEGGRYLRLNGFCWSESDLIGSQLPRPLHILHEAFCSMLPRCLRRMQTAIKDELEQLLTRASWSREKLASLLAHNHVNPKTSPFNSEPCTCTGCRSDFSALGFGLVSPRRIQASEWVLCRERGCTHEQLDECALPETLHQDGLSPNLPSDNDPCGSINGCTSLSIGQELFEDTAVFLYRAQGRRWLSDLPYKPSDRLCATCLLRREGYIGKQGDLATGLTRMPADYEVCATAR